MRNFLILGALLTTLLAVVYATAAEQNVKFQDRQRFLIETGTADVDVSAADYEAGFVNLLTISPADSVAMHDVVLVLDLDKTTTGFNDVATGTVTATFAVQRKIDGTNWRTDIANVTTGITAASAAGRSLEFDLGTIGPTQGARLAVTVGDEATSGDMEFPYVVSYRSGASATFTPVAAD